MKDKEDNTTIIVIVLVGIVLLIFGTFFGNRGGSGGGPSGGSNSAGYHITPHQLDQLEQNVKTWQHNVDRRDDFRARHNLEEK